MHDSFLDADKHVEVGERQLWCSGGSGMIANVCPQVNGRSRGAWKRRGATTCSSTRKLQRKGMKYIQPQRLLRGAPFCQMPGRLE